MKDKRTLSKLRHLLIDMDGVLWRGARPMPGLADFFGLLREQQVGFTLITNNASRTVEHYTKTLGDYGVLVAKEEIITSALATADYLAERYEPDTPVYVVGMKGLRQPLQERGFRLLDDGAEPGSARLVVVGWDRHLTYENLAQATLHIRAGATFVGTNPDRTWPSERGQLPGAGSFLAALQAATGVEPTVIGKPSPLMYQIAMRRMGAQADSTAIVGDRLDTDILGGRDTGLTTILVLSGVTTPQELEHPPVQPDLIFDDIAALTQAWPTADK